MYAPCVVTSLYQVCVLTAGSASSTRSVKPVQLPLSTAPSTSSHPWARPAAPGVDALDERRRCSFTESTGAVSFEFVLSLTVT